MFEFSLKLWNYFWQKPFYRFLLVGVVNTVFGYGTYALLILFGLNYKLAILLSMIINVLFNFATIGRLVFRNSNNLLIFKFVAVYVFVYFANMGGVGLFLKLGFNALAGGALCLLPIAIISFLLNKMIVFKYN